MLVKTHAKWLCVVIFGFCAVACLIGPFSSEPLSAQEPSEGERLEIIQRQLAAGEFGPAANAISQSNNASQRDALRAQLAAAQLGSGAMQAAYSTAAEIENDRAYAAALQQLSQNVGAAGGGTQADFDSLINLITSTIAPQTWDELGGPGAIDGFEGGVYVDAAGLMRRMEQRPGARLQQLRELAAQRSSKSNWLENSEFRKISLPRLERAVLRAYAQGGTLPEELRYLAGLNRITHVLVYPPTGDLVLAGPAGDYQYDAEGRAVSVASGRPLLQLDDLVVVLRNAMTEQSRFGCSITPRQQQLAATKAFLQESSKQPLKPGGRDRWLRELRDTLGRQDITVYGIDPRTRAGRVMIEADYRMKLVGMGLEDGVLGVQSYLESIPRPANGAAPPPMDVLRWWFTLNYTQIVTTEDRNAFELRGKGVQVKSENELLSDLGERIHTGASDDLNRQFAHSFTQHIDQLAMKYPVYAELRNVFDLALVSAIVVREDLPAQTSWTLTHFALQGNYQPQLENAPSEVETVINHRMIGGKHIVAGVSGGVRVDARGWLSEGERMKVDEYGLVKAIHGNARRPENLPRESWWWD